MALYNAYFCTCQMCCTCTAAPSVYWQYSCTVRLPLRQIQPNLDSCQMALHARRYCASWARAQHPGLITLFGSALWVMTVQQHGQTRPCNTRYEVTPAKNRWFWPLQGVTRWVTARDRVWPFYPPGCPFICIWSYMSILGGSGGN
jgi:hypothetical protein